MMAITWGDPSGSSCTEEGTGARGASPADPAPRRRSLYTPSGAHRPSSFKHAGPQPRHASGAHNRGPCPAHVLSFEFLSDEDHHWDDRDDHPGGEFPSRAIRSTMHGSACVDASHNSVRTPSFGTVDRHGGGPRAAPACQARAGRRRSSWYVRAVRQLVRMGCPHPTLTRGVLTSLNEPPTPHGPGGGVVSYIDRSVGQGVAHT